MSNMKISCSLVAFALGVFAQGCATSGSLKGAEKIVATSGAMPTIISEEKWYEENEYGKLFVGFSVSSDDLDKALKSAEMEAKRHLIESIAIDLSVEVARSRSISDKETWSRSFEASQTWLIGNIRETDTTLLTTYWEKWSKLENVEKKYNHHGYAIIQISKIDYARLKKVVLDKLIDKAIFEKDLQVEKALIEVKNSLQSDKE